MSGSSKAIEAASALKLNSCQSGTPFFCLCGVLIYKPFAEHFTEMPVYGLYAQAEVTRVKEGKETSSILSFDGLVESYIAGIEKKLVGKNLVLSGLSFGGIVALEVAKRMKDRGYVVDHIVLFDTYLSEFSHKRSAAKVARDVNKNIRQIGLLSTLKDLKSRLLKKLSHPKSKVRQSNPQTGVRKDTAYYQIIRSYSAANREYAFDVLLIKASQFDMGFGLVSKKDYGLSNIVKGKIDVEVVDAEHTGIVQGEVAREAHQRVIKYISLNRK